MGVRLCHCKTYQIRGKNPEDEGMRRRVHRKEQVKDGFKTYSGKRQVGRPRRMEKVILKLTLKIKT
jgi:hypothetical protein